MELNLGHQEKSIQPLVDTKSKKFSHDEILTHFELIKIIKRYEHCHGWTLLIAPDHLPNKDIMEKCSVNMSKVLIVHKKYCRDVINAANKALKYDNFSALVLWNDEVDAEQIEQVRKTAQENATALYILPTEMVEPHFPSLS